jgi:ankyrin repeat protein
VIFLICIHFHQYLALFADYTAQEYFEANGSTLFPSAAADITQTCLTYLSFDAFTKQHYANFRWPWSDYSLLHYAALHWGHHARRNEEATLEMVQTFLSRKPAVAWAIAVLVEQGVDEYSTSARTDFGQIHVLSYFGLQKLIHQLLKNGCSADSRDGEGQTPLSHAVIQGQLEVVQLLLARGDVKADSKDRSGRSPLSYAAETGNLEVVQLLLARGNVEVDSKDQFGWSPLMYVASRGNLEVVQLLLARGNVEVDSKDQFGWSPLMYAASRGNLEVVQLLLARGDVKADSKD